MAKFKVGDKVKIVRLLDDMTSRELIGKFGVVQELDPLPNGETNYYISGHYMHEAELEVIEGGKQSEQVNPF